MIVANLKDIWQKRRIWTPNAQGNTAQGMAVHVVHVTLHVIHVTIHVIDVMF